MKKLHKYGILAGVMLLLVMVLLLTDVKWFFLPGRQLVEEIVSHEPSAVTEVPTEDIEICLYSGAKEYYAGKVLAEYDGTYMYLLDVCTTVFGDEYGGLGDGNANLHLASPVQVENGKLMFLSPVPVKECMAEGEQFFFSVEIGDKLIQCELEDIFVSGGISSSDMEITCYLYFAETLEEVEEYIFQSEDGIATVKLDKLYYYEYDLTWLQEMILGGA